MKFGEAIRSVFTQYIGFEGRARRSEYWYYTLFIIIVGAAINRAGISMIQNLWSLAIFLPSLAVSIRRLHDIGKSGWWYLIMLVPVIGWILLLIWFCKDSQPMSNEYGPSPKY